MSIEKIFVPGVKCSIAACGIKNDNVSDLLLVTFDNGANVAGAFSSSAIVSETINWDKANLSSKEKAKALIVNSGNANCFTGKHGITAIENIASSLSEKLNILKNSIYISSTGVIGQKLPYEKVIGAMDGCIAGLKQEDLPLAAEAIMTTDTKPKFLHKTSKILDKEVKISVIAKGAGMAAPNLATVLSYIFTDADIPQNILQDILLEILDESFNVFTIDGDMSTNDTVMIFATAKAGNKVPLSVDDDIMEEFRKDLKEIMIEMCDEIVKDGEGVTKMAKINVYGAESKKAAKNVGLAIANSPLVKTAIYGEDPNWGRIVMAVGKAKEKVDLKSFSLNIGGFNIVSNGELNESYDETKTTAPYMKNNSVIDISVDLGVSNNDNHKVTITTCDLSKGYIEINADYRS